MAETPTRNQFGYTNLQIIIGLVAILLLMEACRRVVGLPIVVIALCFVAIGLGGKHLPGFLANRGFTIGKLLQHLFYTQEGIFGTPVGASSTFIFLFILFGAFLEKTGVGEFLSIFRMRFAETGVEDRQKSPLSRQLLREQFPDHQLPIPWARVHLPSQ